MTTLVQACSPRTSLQCLYADTEVAALRAWMASGGTGPALATAVSGSGLTTLVRLLIKEVGLDAVWIGCATPRIKALLEAAGASPVSVTLRRKIIVVDEFDAMTASDSMTASDVLAFARSSPPLPILVVGHSTRSQKSHEFAKGWPLFSFGKPSPATLTKYLLGLSGRIPDARGCDAIIPDVVKSVNGDVRAALMAMDMYRRQGPTTDGAIPPGVKDESIDALDLTEAILRGERGGTVQECMGAFGMQPSVVPMGLYENYLNSLGKADMEAATAAAEGFADADLVDRYLYSRQAWEALDVYGVCAVAVPSMSMKRLRRTPPNPKMGITKFGSVWSKVYNMCAKTKHIKALSMAYADAGLAPLSVCDLAWLRACVRDTLQNKHHDDNDIRRVCHPFSANHVLHLIRLGVSATGSTWYKQTMHSRVKKALTAA